MSEGVEWIALGIGYIYLGVTLLALVIVGACIVWYRATELAQAPRQPVDPADAWKHGGGTIAPAGGQRATEDQWADEALDRLVPLSKLHPIDQAAFTEALGRVGPPGGAA